MLTAFVAYHSVPCLFLQLPSSAKSLHDIDRVGPVCASAPGLAAHEGSFSPSRVRWCPENILSNPRENGWPKTRPDLLIPKASQAHRNTDKQVVPNLATVFGTRFLAWLFDGLTWVSGACWVVFGGCLGRVVATFAFKQCHVILPWFHWTLPAVQDKL